MRACILDITELLRNPMRTGIQRVVRELIRHWPSDSTLHLARFDDGRGLRLISSRITEPLLADADMPLEARAAELRAVAGAPGRLPRAPILIPEVCYLPARWAWYEALRQKEPAAFSMLIHDLVPWNRRDPIVFPYFEMVFRAKRLCYVSEASRDDATRAGSIPGPIFSPGADALGLERQAFAPGRNTWVVIGTVCRNKGHVETLAAFEALWRDGFAGELVFIGRRGEDALAPMLERAKAFPRFRHIPHPPDDVVRQTLRSARATICASHFEGYGIVPLESLHAGIPSIVSDSMPSIQRLPSDGQIRLKGIDASSIERGVRELADDARAAALWDAASRIQLPTWQDFARNVAAWMRDAPNHSRGLLRRLLAA